VQPACAHLATAEPAFAALIGRIGPCLLPVTPSEPYEALIRAIAHQQLHARAAENILGRFVALHPDHAFPPPDHVLAMDDATLRGCGFSASKAAAIRDIAARRLDGTVPGHKDAALLEDGALIERLTTIRGVGRWTVEMLLIFTFGRPDILPVDDFGVREGWRRIQGLDAQPRPKTLAALGEAWAPYRSTAAWYLWRAADEGKMVRKPKAAAPAPETPPASPQTRPAARRGASARRP
jgi:DNA-3-methyladenine glycosylase II